MVVRFEKCELKIDQIHKEEFSKENFVKHEIKVIELIQGWLQNEPTFEFKTSGSTGNAKTISIEREIITYSCETTLSWLDPENKFTSTLLCINPEMIGGAMVVFRALHWGLDLTVMSPSSDAFKLLANDSFYDLTSVVPIQLQNATESQLNKFDTILVGGGKYLGEVSPTNAKIYFTFGMTETVSHFALRSMNDNEYHCIGDVELHSQEDNTLAIQGTITNHKLLKTNDIIEFISSKKFKWLGRSDFIINSGGLKINPEEIEIEIANHIDRKFIISSLEDDRLGNKLILIVEGEPYQIDIQSMELNKYHRPKEIFFMDQLILTHSQKIDRVKTRESLLKQLSIR